MSAANAGYVMLLALYPSGTLTKTYATLVSGVAVIAVAPASNLIDFTVHASAAVHVYATCCVPIAILEKPARIIFSVALRL